MALQFRPEHSQQLVGRASHTDRHPTDLAGLMGARLVTATETEDGRRWAESRIKQLTGGDRISARFMRQDFFDFKPQFKLVIAGNHKPSFRSVVEAMRRRLYLVPFTVTIPPDQRDGHLADRLCAEWGGILNWAIAGLAELQRQGLNPPAIVRQATEEYLTAEDVLGQWLETRCERASARTPVDRLYADWKQFCDEAGEHAGTKKSFSQLLEDRGYQRYRTGRDRGFIGLLLRQG